MSIRHRTIIAAVTVLMGLLLGACNRGGERAAELPTDTPAAIAAQPAANSQQPATPLPPTSTVLPTETPAPTPTPPVGTVTVWHSWAQRDGDALETILQEFAGSYPSLKVETLFVAQDDLLQSYAQAVADGRGPDVVLAPNWWLHELYTAGAVSPLDESVYAAALAGLWPAAVDNLRIDGQLFGVPTNYETVALFYNRGLAPENSLPGTLQELAAMAQQSPTRGIGIYANPFHIAWGFHAYGSRVFDDAGRAVIDQSAGTGEFLQWLADLDALEGSYVDSDYGMLLDRFKRGEFAFFVDGPWAIPDLSQALGNNLGVTAIPRGPAGDSRPWLYADAAYVNPNLTQPQSELAALFIAHLTSPESGAVLAEVAQRLPANQSAALGDSALIAGFAAQAQSADAMRHGEEMDAFWRYGGDMILRATAGTEDLQAIVAETAALTNEATGR